MNHPLMDPRPLLKIILSSDKRPGNKLKASQIWATRVLPLVEETFSGIEQHLLGLRPLPELKHIRFMMQTYLKAFVWLGLHPGQAMNQEQIRDRLSNKAGSNRKEIQSTGKEVI